MSDKPPFKFYHPFLLMALVLGPFFIFSCSDKSQPVINVYHWQSVWSFDKQAHNTIKDLGSRRVYVRFFDVVYQAEKEGVYPNAVLSNRGDKPPSDLELVPVVFIQNDALRLGTENPSKMAGLIWQKLERMARTFGVSFDEVQLDCDWTLSTRERYFELCKSFKELMPDGCELSSTIRLHQIKYPQTTGIPPVDKGMLMLYNMGDLNDSSERNSIFNWGVAKNYLEGIPSYELPLSIALPVFSWAVVYDEGRVKAIINNVDETVLLEKIGGSIGNRIFQANENIYFKGVLIEKNDHIRYERVTLRELEMAYLEINRLKHFSEVVLYHLKGQNLIENEAKDIRSFIDNGH